MVIDNPDASLVMPVRTEKSVELLCEMTMINLLLPLSYNLLMLFLCAIFGFLTRKLPDNFNESWYIFISATTTIFIWVAFLPTHMMAFYAYHKAALLSLALILNGTTTLICLFVPKLYALFFVNDQEIQITNFSTETSESNGSKRSTASDITNTY